VSFNEFDWSYVCSQEVQREVNVSSLDLEESVGRCERHIINLGILVPGMAALLSAKELVSLPIDPRKNGPRQVLALPELWPTVTCVRLSRGSFSLDTRTYPLAMSWT
jgi:hypothetical protein